MGICWLIACSSTGMSKHFRPCWPYVLHLGHMFYTFVDIIDFVGNLVQASKKFQEEVGVTEVVGKLETGNVSLPSHSERHLSNHIPGTSPGQ
jgi:hypothetical protein